MAFMMKLGSKADVFHLEGQSWLCVTGLPSDVRIEVGEISFRLHKFPLLSRCGSLEKLVQESSALHRRGDEEIGVVPLHDLPGGAKSFLLVAKFCYGVKIEITAVNVVGLRCAAEYLQMNESYEEGNLISQTESFLDEVLENWVDTVKALESCEASLPLSEDLHIISRCIDSLAAKACSDPSLLSWPVAGRTADDWWYDNVAVLKVHVFKRLVLAVGSKGMAPERVAGLVMFYAKRYLPLNGRQASSRQRSKVPVMSDSDQRALIEDIVELLPDQKGVTPTRFLIRLLRTSMILHASPPCREVLERRIGLQLDEAALEDLLIPNTGYSVETLYDIECVQRIVNHFMLVDGGDEEDSKSGAGQLAGGCSQSLTPMTIVSDLLDKYLAEIAPDCNLKLEKFVSLASVIPDNARLLDDGIYRAIDTYLKAHPRLTDSEKEQLCRLLSCQKLSAEATAHAAQNERLPLRVVVHALFSEQLRLRTSVAEWFFVSDSIENSQNLAQRNGSFVPMSPEGGQIVTFDGMAERVTELEKECENMKLDVEKIVRTKGSWNNLCKRFVLKFKGKCGKLPCKGRAL